MHPTPKIPTHLDFLKVYEPAGINIDFKHFNTEDTFALMDCIEEDFKNWPKDFCPLICLEVGSGTGLGLTFVGSLLSQFSKIKADKKRPPFVAAPLLLATDLNPYAAYATQETGSVNQLLIDVILCDLASPLLNRLKGKIDVIVFNPPYVPTSSEEVFKEGKSNEQDDVCSQAIAASWAGGVDGREVIDRFLLMLPSLLSYPYGTAYLVTVNENKPTEIVKSMKNILKAEIKLVRKAGRERLHIIKFGHLKQ